MFYECVALRPGGGRSRCLRAVRACRGVGFLLRSAPGRCAGVSYCGRVIEGELPWVGLMMSRPSGVFFKFSARQERVVARVVPFATCRPAQVLRMFARHSVVRWVDLLLGGARPSWQVPRGQLLCSLPPGRRGRSFQMFARHSSVPWVGLLSRADPPVSCGSVLSSACPSLVRAVGGVRGPVAGLSAGVFAGGAAEVAGNARLDAVLPAPARGCRWVSPSLRVRGDGGLPLRLLARMRVCAVSSSPSPLGSSCCGPPRFSGSSLSPSKSYLEVRWIFPRGCSFSSSPRILNHFQFFQKLQIGLVGVPSCPKINGHLAAVRRLKNAKKLSKNGLPQGAENRFRGFSPRIGGGRRIFFRRGYVAGRDFLWVFAAAAPPWSISSKVGAKFTPNGPTGKKAPKGARGEGQVGCPGVTPRPPVDFGPTKSCGVGCAL